MKKHFQFGLLSALLLSSIGLAANAQSFYFNNGLNNGFNNGFHRFYNDRDSDRDFDRDRGLSFGSDRDFDRDRGLRFGWGHHWDMSLQHQRAFDNRVAQLRREINFRVNRGIISTARGNILTARLDDIVVRERQMAADGRLTGGELSMLESRLNNVQFAMRGGFRYY